VAEFTVNPERFDPYKNFKFRVKWVYAIPVTASLYNCRNASRSPHLHHNQ